MLAKLPNSTARTFQALTVIQKCLVVREANDLTLVIYLETIMVINRHLKSFVILGTPWYKSVLFVIEYAQRNTFLL